MADYEIVAINTTKGVFAMKYHEIVSASDRARQVGNGQPKNQRSLSVRNAEPKLVEEPINRLYHDLMCALEGRMMNIETAKRRGR